MGDGLRGVLNTQRGSSVLTGYRAHARQLRQGFAVHRPLRPDADFGVNMESGSDFIERALPDDLAARNDRDSIGKLLGLVDIVSREKDGTAFGSQLAEP